MFKLFLYCIILGSTARWCPTSPHFSLGDVSRLLELPTVRDGVHRLFLFRLPYLGVFPSLFTCHWFSFVVLLYEQRICTHSIDPSLADGEFPGLGLALVLDGVVPEAEHGVHMKQKSRFKCLP